MQAGVRNSQTQNCTYTPAHTISAYTRTHTHTQTHAHARIAHVRMRIHIHTRVHGWVVRSVEYMGNLFLYLFTHPSNAGTESGWCIMTPPPAGCPGPSTSPRSRRPLPTTPAGCASLRTTRTRHGIGTAGSSGGWAASGRCLQGGVHGCVICTPCMFIVCACVHVGVRLRACAHIIRGDWCQQFFAISAIFPHFLSDFFLFRHFSA